MSIDDPVGGWRNYVPEYRDRIEDLSRRTYGSLHDFADEWRHLASEPGPDVRPQARWVLEEGGGAIFGYAGIHTEPWMVQVSKRRLDVLPLTDPQFATEAFERLENRCREHAVGNVQVRALADGTDSSKFLISAGYHPAEEMWDLALDVAAPSETPVGETEHPYSIDSLADLASNRPSAFAELHGLWIAVAEDQPGYDPATAPPLEKFIAWLQSPNRDANGTLIAHTPEALIGLTMLQPRANQPGWLTQNITGVIREWRRRGVGKALKRTGVRYARSVGAVRIVTSNSPANEAVLKLNLGAGFVPVAKWLTLEKELS